MSIPTCCNFGELVDLEIDKATLSHHLNEPECAGLIGRIRDGRRVDVRANLDGIEMVRHFLDSGGRAEP